MLKNFYEISLKKTDESFLFIASSEGSILQWNTNTQKKYRNFENISDGKFIMTMTNNRSKLFTVDCTSNILQQINLDNNSTSGINQVSWGRKKIHDLTITQMKVSIEDDYLFTVDVSGRIKQWYIKERCLSKDFGVVHDSPICNLLIINHPLQTRSIEHDLHASDSFDGLMNSRLKSQSSGSKSNVKHNFFNMITCDMNSNIKQWCIKKNKSFPMSWNNDSLYPEYKNLKAVHKNTDTPSANTNFNNSERITSISASNNGNFLFTWFGHKGHLKQWCLITQCLLKDFGKTHEGAVIDNLVTDNWMFTADDQGFLKQWSLSYKNLSKKIILEMQLTRSWGRVCGFRISALAIHQNFLFIGDSNGNLNQFEYENEDTRFVKEFEKVIKDGCITEIIASN